MNGSTTWTMDQQQVTFVKQVFDVEVHDDPILVALNDIDESQSLSVGQNRTEMMLDQDTIDILSMYMDDGVALPMPLVWKSSPRAKRVVVLDGNHRIAAALRSRNEPSCSAVLVTGDVQIAQRIAMVVNTQHGRSTRNGEYMATTMRLLREQNVPIPQIARMFGVTDAQVGIWTRRDAQLERVRSLIPERRAVVKAHTLDCLGQLEDAHIRILGELFLDAPKASQDEYVRRIRETSSAMRDAIAHEVLGELREVERMRRKVKPTTTRPSSQLQGALQRLVGILDPTRAYYGSTDQQKAIMRSNLAVVMPRLQRMWTTVSQQQSQAIEEVA